MEKVAKIVGQHEMKVYEVATFYTMFNREKRGKHFIQLCGTTPCMVCGSEDIKKTIMDELGIKNGGKREGERERERERERQTDRQTDRKTERWAARRKPARDGRKTGSLRRSRIWRDTGRPADARDSECKGALAVEYSPVGPLKLFLLFTKKSKSSQPPVSFLHQVWLFMAYDIIEPEQ